MSTSEHIALDQLVMSRGSSLRIEDGSGITIRVRWGGLKPRRKLARRLKHRPKLTFVVRLTDAKRHTTRFELTVRPSVRR